MTGLPSGDSEYKHLRTFSPESGSGGGFNPTPEPDEAPGEKIHQGLIVQSIPGQPTLRGQTLDNYGYTAGFVLIFSRCPTTRFCISQFR